MNREKYELLVIRQTYFQIDEIPHIFEVIPAKFPFDNSIYEQLVAEWWIEQ